MKANWKTVGVAAVGLCVLTTVAAWITVPYHNTITRGTDSFETHHLVYADQVVTYSFETHHTITQLGIIPAILVPERDTVPLHVSVRTDAMEHATTINPGDLQDDTFFIIELPQPLSAGSITITAAAPEATNQNPLGVRFEEASGDLALTLTQWVPVWERIVIWQQQHTDTAQQLATALIFAAGALIGVGLIERLPFSSRTKLLIGLVLLASATVTIRIPTAMQIESAFGGDAFNYLYKAQVWLTGEDPFSADPRKAPLLSFLLLPSFILPIDYLTFGRIINITLAAATAVLTALFLRRLKQPRPVALLGGLLLAVNREWQWETIHTLANPLHAFFFALAAYTLTYMQLPRARYLLGVVTGAAFLARYEAALIGATLPFVWIFHRLRPKSIAHTLIPAAILIAVPFMLWPITGLPGVRTAGDIADDPGLYIAGDTVEFQQNLDRFEDYVGRLWILQPLVGRQFAALGIGAATGIALILLHRSHQNRTTHHSYGVFIAAGLITTIIIVLIFDDPNPYKKFSLLLTTLIGVGSAILAVKHFKIVAPLFVALTLHTGFITAILPKTRYYLPLVPFAVIALTISIAHLINPQQRSHIATSACLAILIGLIAANAATHIPPAISDYNTNSANQTVLRDVSRYLVGHPGTAAVARPDITTQVYLDDRRRVVPDEIRGDLQQSSAAQLDWLKTEHPTYVIETTTQPFWTILETNPDQFELIMTATTRFADDEARLYRFLRSAQ